MVEFQPPSEALTCLQPARGLADPVGGRGKEDHIPLPLLVPFAVIMLNVIQKHMPERGLAKY